MNTQLFVPDRIRVGYQKRHDTYTKKLAYIIYWDQKGVLRKEKSWKSWCDSKIPHEDFDNKPHNGFTLNKDVKRSREWFGSGRNMIRVYDDRGFEFEITTGNLLFILMTTDCLRRGLQGEFVYAWDGTELILLPTECQEFEQASKFTKLQACKVSAKALVAGHTYRDKKERLYVYMGHHVRHEWTATRQDRAGNAAPRRHHWHDEVTTSYTRKCKKRHIWILESQFRKPATSGNLDYHSSADVSFISEEVSDVIPENYADYAVKLLERREFRAIEEIFIEPRAQGRAQQIEDKLTSRTGKNSYIMESAYKIDGCHPRSAAGTFELQVYSPSIESKYIHNAENPNQHRYRYMVNGWYSDTKTVSFSQSKELVVTVAPSSRQHWSYHDQKVVAQHVDKSATHGLMVRYDDGKILSICEAIDGHDHL